MSDADIRIYVDASTMRHVGTALSGSRITAQGFNLGVRKSKQGRVAYLSPANLPSHHKLRNRKMDTPRRQRRSPLGILCLPRPGVLPVFAALSFAAVLVLLTMVSRLHLELLRSRTDPYHHEYAGQGVHPLLGTGSAGGRKFDVGVSVFAFKPINVTARPECAPLADARWIADYSGPQLRRVSPDGSEAERELIHLAKQVNMVHPERSASACNLLYVPETEELWSGIVAHNMTHRDKHLRAFFDVDIPTQFL